MVGPCDGPATFLLLEGTPFVIPNDPRVMAIYLQWAPPTTVKIIDTTFLHDKNYFLSSKNIARTCFRMFDTNIAAQFKSVQHPISDRMEFNNDHHQDPSSTTGFLWQAKHDVVVQQ
jgi:hypothetical protein